MMAERKAAGRSAGVSRYLRTFRLEWHRRVRDDAEGVLVRLLGEPGRTAGALIEVVNHGAAFGYGWEACERLGPDYVRTGPAVEMVTTTGTTPEGIAYTLTVPKVDAEWDALVRRIAWERSVGETVGTVDARVALDKAEIHARAERPDLWRTLEDGRRGGRLADTWAAAMAWALADCATQTTDDPAAMERIDCAVATSVRALAGDPDAAQKLKLQLEARRRGADLANEQKRQKRAPKLQALRDEYNRLVTHGLDDMQPEKLAKAAAIKALARQRNVTVKHVHKLLGEAGVPSGASR